MRNINAKQALKDCWVDIECIRKEIEKLPSTDIKVSYLTLYALIRACGTIEYCLKLIVTEFVCQSACNRTRLYIEKSVLKSPKNPSIDNMSELLSRFDSNWSSSFTNKVQISPRYPKLKSSIKSLSKLRNAFAHGENITASFKDIRMYYADTWRILCIYDDVVQ